MTVPPLPSAGQPRTGSPDAPRRVAGPGAAARALARLDTLATRAFGAPWNPLYRSGAATVALLLVLVVTGLYLLLFYRVGAPWASVARLHDQALLGRWIRTVHRLAADAAVVTALVHMWRMFAQRRTWGSRTLPWVSGIGLLALIFVCGWTGYVMVWDVFGQAIAIEAARVLDLVPLFSEPLGRAFAGERALPSAFFFLNLFLHIALPIGVGVALMLHVSRVARPVLLPPRGLLWGGSVVLVLVALAWPAPMPPEASPFRMATDVPLDVFYATWLPLARRLPAWGVAAIVAASVALLLLVPRLTRPAPEKAPLPSTVNERVCTGCEQCALDCPWEAITMVARSDGRATLVARVDPDRCVSCGICAASCAPMGVGPAGRTGRDQLARVRAFVASRAPGPRDVVVIACGRGAGGSAAAPQLDGAHVYAVDCAGAVHTSVVEYMLRAGAGGVLLAACPVHDCWNREGPTWLAQRLYEGREAELQERVDRRRVAVVHASLADHAPVRRALDALRAQVRALALGAGEGDFDLVAECEARARVAAEDA